jgi:hypothetical protein
MLASSMTRMVPGSSGWERLGAAEDCRDAGGVDAGRPAELVRGLARDGAPLDRQPGGFPRLARGSQRCRLAAARPADDDRHAVAVLGESLDHDALLVREMGMRRQRGCEHAARRSSAACVAQPQSSGESLPLCLQGSAVEYTTMTRATEANRLYVIAERERDRDRAGFAPAEPVRNGRALLAAALTRSRAEELALDQLHARRERDRGIEH